jgi:hypothetical protein
MKMRMRKQLGIVLLLTGRFCGNGGEISDDYYKQLPKTNHRTTSNSTNSSHPGKMHEQVESTDQDVTEIGIERCGSIWGGSVFTFIATSDGKFRYHGVKEVERKGKFAGTIPLWQFQNLAKFIRDSGYMEFADEYHREITDSATTFTSVTFNGKRKIIENYANSGPTSLWAIQELIEGLMAKATWERTQPRVDPVLPTVTPYDNDAVLRAAYLDSYHDGFIQAWESREKLPVFNPTTERDKAIVLGYGEGIRAGQAARVKWMGTNSQTSPTNRILPKR